MSWFPEPALEDNTYARRQEHTLDWLARSTIDRAVECRRFLNHNVARLPTDDQGRIVAALRSRWRSAFFELVVARFLQELEAAVSIELANTGGKRPDFRAEFSDGSVIVEAVAPVFNAAIGQEAKRQVPLISFIEANVPEGWCAGILELPDIGLSDSRQQFQAAVREMLRVPPPRSLDETLDLAKDLPSGTVKLQLLARRPDWTHRLAWEAPLGGFDDSMSRIARAVKRKREQVRESQEPVLLAIHASGISSDWEDFDRALFGSTWERRDHRGHVLDVGFHADGVFAKAGNSKPTYAGVLAFLAVGFSVCDGPVLYHHPRFEGPLPAPLLSLQQRSCDSLSRTIIEKPSQVPGLMDAALGLVRV